MLKVDILCEGRVTHSASFEDEETLGCWLKQESSNFGRPEEWVNEPFGRSILDQREVEIIPPILDAQGAILSPGSYHQEYLVAADYQVEVTDITEQVKLEQEIQRGLRNQAFGAQVIARIFAINNMKFASGLLDTASYLAFMMNPQTQFLMSLLNPAGSIGEARNLIAAFPTTLFTASEIASIVGEMDSYLAS